MQFDPVTDDEAAACLPEDPHSFLYQYCEYGYERGESPLIYHVANALGLLSVTAPPTLRIDTLPGSTIHANWWCICSGRPALDRKSTAVGFAEDIADMAIFRRIGPEPINWEGMRESLQEQPSQIVFLSEMGDFFARMEATYARSLKSNLLKVYDCRPVSYRSARKKVNIANPRVSFVGAANPSVISQHVSPQDWESGFMSRWAIFYSHKSREVLLAPPNRARMDWLAEWLKDAVDTPCGRCLGFDDKSLKLWETWNRDLARRVGDGRNFSTIAAYGRTPTTMAKAAMLMSFDELEEARLNRDWYIPLRITERAVRLAELHYRSSVLLAELSHANLDMRNRAQVLTCIGEGWTQESQILRGSQLLKNRFDQVIETLVCEETIEHKVVNGKSCYRKAREEVVADSLAPEIDDLLQVGRQYAQQPIEA